MVLKNFFPYLAGLSLAFSYDDLSYNKIATQSHTFIGWNTYYASSAMDRNASSCTRTNAIGRISTHKTVWWKVDLGGVYNIFSITILFKNYHGFEIRQRGRFAGFSLYISNTSVSTTGDIQSSIVCYKDGPELPPLNFTTKCVKQGRYIIFYNERLEEVIYPQEYESIVITELCEVIVKGCDTLMYDNNCAPCPTNCEDNICQDGKCFACKPGWVGMFCNKKCIEGWYGDNCNQQCQEHCRDNATCNHVTGLCDKSSVAGWTGSICDKESQQREYVTPWMAAFLTVLLIVVLLIIGGFVCVWILHKRLFNGDTRLCWKTLFQARTVTLKGNTTEYLEPISNTNANYQELSPNNIYHELNPNTTYQELKIQYVEINQYQSTTL